MSKAIVESGNIAAGKTTLAARLAKRLDWHFEPESVQDNPYLVDFYKNMSPWSLHVLCHFLGHRSSQYENALNNNKPTILDRSLYDDINVFAPALRHAGYFSPRDYQTYIKVAERIAKGLKPPSLVIHLTAPIEILLQRIRNRGREFEQRITAEYLQLIDEFYEVWISNIDFCPVVEFSYREYNDFNIDEQLERAVVTLQSVVAI